jgi:hypothetical protein
MSGEKNDSYVRWQGRTIEQMGYAINTILLTTMASVGFSIAQLLRSNIDCYSRCFIKDGVVVLFICIILIMLLILNRLIDFRETAKNCTSTRKRSFEWDKRKKSFG